MTDKSIDQPLTFYQEDVTANASGVVLIGRPGTVWTLVLTDEISEGVVISLSDDSTGYNASHRIGKIVITGPTTIWHGFGKGLFLSRGLSAVANGGSADMWGVYE